jgi:hypothetical protein
MIRPREGFASAFDIVSVATDRQFIKKITLLEPARQGRTVTADHDLLKNLHHANI